MTKLEFEEYMNVVTNATSAQEVERIMQLEKHTLQQKQYQAQQKITTRQSVTQTFNHTDRDFVDKLLLRIKELEKTNKIYKTALETKRSKTYI